MSEEVEPNTTESSATPNIKANDLGPFAPPVDFDHGEEFEGNAPRDLPRFVKTGSYAQRQRGVLYTLFVLGLMFVVFWPIPFVQGLSHYILPLKYLHWIGLGLIGIAVCKFFIGLVSSGRYKYIREGTPFVGRVLSIDHAYLGNEQAPQFKFAATVEFDHPETGQHEPNAVLVSEDNWMLSEIGKYDCTLQPGDYVTLVGLPGKIESTTRLYGFLGLDPEREYLHKNGRPLRGVSPFTAVMIAFLIGTIVVLIMAAFDTLMFSFPVAGDWKFPAALAAGGFFLAGLCGTATFYVGQKENQAPEGSPLGAFFVGGILGAFAAPCLLFILNSRLDVGDSQLEPIRIVNYWQTTHNFIIRDYEVEYDLTQGEKNQKHHIRMSQLMRLDDAEYGVLEKRPGRFGYTWISGIHPAYWIHAENAADVPAPAYKITNTNGIPGPDGEMLAEILVKPVVELDDHRLVPMPEDLNPRTLVGLRQTFENVELAE